MAQHQIQTSSTTKHLGNLNQHASFPSRVNSVDTPAMKDTPVPKSDFLDGQITRSELREIVHKQHEIQRTERFKQKDQRKSKHAVVNLDPFMEAFQPDMQNVEVAVKHYYMRDYHGIAPEDVSHKIILNTQKIIPLGQKLVKEIEALQGWKEIIQPFLKARQSSNVIMLHSDFDILHIGLECLHKWI